ncbi:MAG TPA: LiaF domain-containing protein [Acidimicrobiia bacterium]|nr:LiaF domain-containing protein [Acidimicrobiia bacterium]
MNSGRTLFGALVAGLGILFLLDATGAVDAGEVISRWWPAAIVALGVFQGMAGSTRRSATVLVLVGLGLLAVTSGILGSAAWGYVWPVALVLVGLWILFGWGNRYGSRPADDEEVDGIAVLGSARLATRSQSFRRASVTAILGGVTLDLSEARPVAGGATVTITSLLGGVAVLVPPGWLVEIRGLPLLGGWDDTTDRSAVGADPPRLEVQVLVALGGIEVKHPAGRWK